MRLIAEEAYDLSYTQDKMRVRLYEPEKDLEHDTWFCSFQIDEPFNVDRKIYGASSLQALCLALQTLSANLYGSTLYKNKELGVDGVFGGNLFIPASHMFLDRAPYPF
jgi:hypothetical protein